MKLNIFLLIVVAFCMFIAGGSLIIGDVEESYELDLRDDDFNSTYNKIDEMYDISQDMKDQTLDAEIDDTESWESMSKGSYSAIRLVGNTFTLVGDMINAISRKIGIPAFFVKFALVALTIGIIFGIIFLVMRFKG